VASCFGATGRILFPVSSLGGGDKSRLREEVAAMAAQNDLVTVLGRFDPKLVKMAPSGERPED